MKTGTLLQFGLLCLLVLTLPIYGQPRPNIVVIMTDQQQAHALGREGFGLDTSPFRDALARQGVWLNRAYTSTPECAPARLSLLTGRFCSAHGARANPTVDSQELRLGTTDMVRLLRSIGYTTALIGKNHTYLKRCDLDYLSGETGSEKGDASGRGLSAEEARPQLLGRREAVGEAWEPGLSELAQPFTKSGLDEDYET